MPEFINTIDNLGDDAVIDSIIDRSITEFKDDEISSISAYAFYVCKSLTTIELPNVTIIGKHAFHDCVSLKNVDLSGVGALDEYIFQGCTSLEEIRLPNLGLLNITNGDRFYHGVFEGCTSLLKVDLGFSKLNFYRTTQFKGCSSLVALIMRRTDAINHPSSSISLADTPIASGTGYIYVPRALVDSYKSATNWSPYATQFRAIEDYSEDGTVDGVIHVVSNRLTHVQNSNTDFSTKTTYYATLTPDDGWLLSTVNVFMGGIDITDTAYDGNGNIFITSVIGDIVITAKANRPGQVLYITPINGSDEGDLPKYKLDVTAGEKLELIYYLTKSQGYLYDGRNCGLNYIKGEQTLNAETIITIDIPSDGYIIFSDHRGSTINDGELSASGGDRLYGRYLIVSSI